MKRTAAVQRLRSKIQRVWHGATQWLRGLGPYDAGVVYSEIDDDGLLTAEIDSDGVRQPGVAETRQPANVLVKAVHTGDRRESLEKLQQGFERLIEQLQGINHHLDCQIVQQQELMRRLEQLPQVLGSLPGLVDGQRKVTQGLLDQMRVGAARDQRLMDALDRIPAETARQNETLTDIHQQLSESMATDSRMAEQFTRFASSVDKLQESTTSQAESIGQLQQTFAANDRYFRYMMARQEKRFNRILAVMLGAGLIVLVVLVAALMYYRK